MTGVRKRVDFGDETITTDKSRAFAEFCIRLDELNQAADGMGRDRLGASLSRIVDAYLTQRLGEDFESPEVGDIFEKLCWGYE